MRELKLPAWAATLGVALALAALVVYSFLERWEMLTSSPFPLGVDGYFYPIQLRALLEHEPRLVIRQPALRHRH